MAKKRPPEPRGPRRSTPSKKTSPRRSPASIGGSGLDRLVERWDLGSPTGQELVTVARLGRPWGVRGDITVRLTSPDSDLEWADDVVWLQGEAFPLTPVSVDGWQLKGNKLLVRFEGVTSPEQAAALTHQEVRVPKAWLPEPEDPDEHYVHELLGMAVEDELKGPMGTIAEVFTTGANDVWVVRGGAEEVLIPAVKGVVQEVDRDRRTVRVRYEEL